VNCLFSVIGIVKPYSGMGRKLGYPTANIECPAETEEGVFVGYTYLDGKKLSSIIFIGIPETFNETKKRAESYILDFDDKDLYGEEITLEVIKKLRDNRRFDSQQNLIAQMKEDERWAKDYFSGQFLQG
jgi:riboflavin kinase/FMN adenylyltransferase